MHSRWDSYSFFNVRSTTHKSGWRPQSGSKNDPGNTLGQLGLHPGWNTSLLHGNTHSHILPWQFILAKSVFWGDESNPENLEEPGRKSTLPVTWDPDQPRDPGMVRQQHSQMYHQKTSTAWIFYIINPKGIGKRWCVAVLLGSFSVSFPSTECDISLYPSQIKSYFYLITCTTLTTLTLQLVSQTTPFQSTQNHPLPFFSSKPLFVFFFLSLFLVIFFILINATVTVRANFILPH